MDGNNGKTIPKQKKKEFEKEFEKKRKEFEKKRIQKRIQKTLHEGHTAKKMTIELWRTATEKRR